MKTRISSIVAFFLLLTAAATMDDARAASGGYGSSTATPTIYSKNFWYSVAYPVVGSPPATATLTTVYYTWDYPYPRPAGLVVYLCNSTGTLCGDVTNSGSGSVNFSGYGEPANQPLRLYTRVNGTGTMAPLAARPTSVTVNYVF